MTDASNRPPTPGPNRALHIALWIAQILLLVAFGAAGAMRLFVPLPQLAATTPWAADVPALLLRFIGLAEIAGAIGLVLPALTRTRPGLVPLAALGLVTIMVFAVVFHLVRGETLLVVPNLVLGALAGFVAWGRARRVPIAPRRAR